jgi:hypothetical protein
MPQHFMVYETWNWLTIRKISTIPFQSISFEVDRQPVHSFADGLEFYLDKSVFDPGEHWLSVSAQYTKDGVPSRLTEHYWFHVSGEDVFLPEFPVDYRAGDILIACDNVIKPRGYMGHAAIVVDRDFTVEAVSIRPIIRKIPNSRFVCRHPVHAHYRPLSVSMGLKAARYAERYLQHYEDNLENGLKKPAFALFHPSPLDDPWKYIYCSKLVWLSYYYGAGYAFSNDFLWFSPEDLHTVLERDPHFVTVYKHPRFRFVVNL